MLRKPELLVSIKWIVATFASIIIFPNQYVSGINALSARMGFNQTQAIMSIMIVVVLMFFERKLRVYKNNWIDWCIGCVLALLLATTEAFSSIEISPYVQGSGYFTDSIENIILSLIFIIGYTIIFSTAFKIIKFYFGVRCVHVPISSKKIFILLSCIWLIQIIAFLPGTISWDAFRQFAEYEHLHISSLNFTYVPTNHHPWFVSMFFGVLYQIGQTFGGTNSGVLLITVVQFLISGLIYTQAINFSYQMVGKWMGNITFALFASPIFAIYAQTIDKSSLFYAFCVWFTINHLRTSDLLFKQKQVLKKDIFLLVISGFFMMMFRNDGAYVALISLLSLSGLSVILKRNIVKIISAFIIIFLCFVGWQKLVLPVMNVIPGSPGEAITIPMRQISYTYITHPESFSVTDKKTLNAILPTSKISQNYNVNMADNLKSLYPVNTFLRSEDEIRNIQKGTQKLKTTKKIRSETTNFMRLWLVKGLQHPLAYLKIYIQASSNFLNPFFNATSNNDALFTQFSYMNDVNFLHPIWYHSYHYWLPSRIQDLVRGVITMLFAFPPLAIVSNVGFPIWAAIVLLGLVIAKLKWKYLLVMVPLILLTLVPTLSPVNGYSRYGIMGLAILPIMLAYIWNKVHYVKE